MSSTPHEQESGESDEPGVARDEGRVQAEEMEGAADGDGPVSDPGVTGRGTGDPQDRAGS